MTDHATDPTPAPDATCHAWRPWGDSELSCALPAGHQGHHGDGEGRTWTDAQAEQEARDDDSGETPIPGAGYRWPATDPTPAGDPARLDLDAIEADLDEVRRNVDHGEAQYNPHALTALRAAEALVARVRQLETERDADRVTHRGELADVAAAAEMLVATARRDGAADALDHAAAHFHSIGHRQAGNALTVMAAQTRTGARAIPTTTTEETL